MDGKVKRDALAFLAEPEHDVVALASRLIAAPSPNLPGDERAPTAVVQDALAALDLPPGTVYAAEPHRPNLVVRIEGGRPGPRLALCGHLDTKPVGDAATWRTDPFTPTIDGHRLYGLGATDMKGAVAAIILSGAAFARVADRVAGSLTLLLTADEEYGSRLGAEYLVKHAPLDVDAIILGEPSGITQDWEAIRIVSRGFSGFRVIVQGTQIHSSISDIVPTVNAVEAMAKVMTGLRRELHPTYPPHPLCPNGPTVNIGVKALGGVGYGVLPGQAEFWCDIRTTPGMSFEQLRRDIDEAVARVAEDVPNAKVGWEFSPDLRWIDATEVSPEHPAVQAAQRAGVAVLGRELPVAAFPGASDAWPFQGMGGIPTIASFGPGLLPLAHGPNEWVSIKSLRQACQIYALTALEYCSA